MNIINYKNKYLENLSEIIVKRNKNYLKKNKVKEFKNVWLRRIRQKTEVNYY